MRYALKMHVKSHHADRGIQRFANILETTEDVNSPLVHLNMKYHVYKMIVKISRPNHE